MLAFTRVSLRSLTDWVCSGWVWPFQCLDSFLGLNTLCLASWLFTSRSGVLSFLSAKMPLFHFYSGKPTCERAAWRHLSTESTNVLWLYLQTQFIFCLTGFQGEKSLHPLPVCVYLHHSRVVLVHFSSMIGPSWHHHAEVLNVVTFLRASSTSFHNLDRFSFGPDTDTLSLFL